MQSVSHQLQLLFKVAKRYAEVNECVEREHAFPAARFTEGDSFAAPNPLGPAGSIEWSEFLECVCHKFEPASTCNAELMSSKRNAFGSVVCYLL